MTMSKRVGYLIFALTAVAFIVFAVMMERAGAGADQDRPPDLPGGRTAVPPVCAGDGDGFRSAAAPDRV